MSEPTVQENEPSNSHDTDGLMTKAEALAIAWTGIEVLAKTRQANLYRSPKTGRVVIELLATEYEKGVGLKPIGG